uniref:Uncharacterized protein n=1 Tax=Nelumbo nucifera TaxID=4432 RepID=A0A822ZT53_NELNU|nr:TPA_asm: hypothetical protein HUJ06_004317 [Nelumbo nucifera]
MNIYKQRTTVSILIQNISIFAREILQLNFPKFLLLSQLLGITPRLLDFL